MHAAPSVIAFTTLSGAGYGLFGWLCLSILIGNAPSSGASAAITFVAGLLATIGLLCSLFHLGHPERAWRALSQWRSSWLSREGVLAILAYLPMAVLFFGAWSVPLAALAKPAAAIGLALSVATVFATSMIYRSINAIPAWANHWVPLNYLLMAIASGAVILRVFDTSWYVPGADASYFPLLHPTIPPAALFFAAFGKILYWQHVDGFKSPDTVEAATGLKGDVKVFEQPHSSGNYLTDEMGARIARALSMFIGVLAPVIFTSMFYKPIPNALAVVLCLAGFALERWLFFTEAKHTTMLYYGRDMN